MSGSTLDQDILVELTADIVAAHVSHNEVPVAQVSNLITGVYETLAGLGGEQKEEETAREPAVSIRASVKPTHVTCLDCGRSMKTLKRHLREGHSLTPDEYRARWNLSSDHLLAAPAYLEGHRARALTRGFGRKPRQKGKGAQASTAPTKPLATESKTAKKKLTLRYK